MTEDWNPSKHKTTYILGAGTSVTCGAPVIANFREAARRVLVKGGVRWGSPELARHNRRIFGETLQAWAHHFPSYNVEEFYVLADLHERMRLSPEILESYRLRPLADCVRYVICKTLAETMGRGPSDVHEAFVQKTWHHAAERSDNVSVITLNWDIALDNASERVFGAPAMDSGYEQYARPGYGIQQDRAYRIYKLHGSMNWWFCPTCKTLWYDRGEKTLLGQWEHVEEKRCPGGACEEQVLAPGMIPPMSQKMEKSEISYFMHSIWYAARKALLETDWLVIAGYSFPPTDVQFRMFVAEALARNPRLRGITILTNRKVGQARAAFEDSYAQLIHSLPSEVAVNFRYEGFERWVAKGCSGR